MLVLSLKAYWLRSAGGDKRVGKGRRKRSVVSRERDLYMGVEERKKGVRTRIMYYLYIRI